MICYKLKELFLQRSSFLLSFGKCACSVSKKAVSFVLCLIIAFSVCVPAFAEDLPITDFDITLKKEITEGSTISSYNFAYTTSVSGDQLFIKPIDKDNFWTGQAAELCTAFKTSDLTPGHEYFIKFKAGTNFASPCTVKVILDGMRLYTGEFSYAEYVSFKFKAPDVIRESSLFTISLEIGVPQGYSNGIFIFSNTIEFEDLTENPSWLRKILNAFSDIGTTLSNSFSNLTQSISDFFSDFKSNWNAGIEGIKGKIKDFSDSLNNKLNSMWQTITEIKTTIQNKIDEIKNSITQKIEDIKEEIKSWFIPSEGYFESKKTELETFCTEHFGALYQVPDLMIEFIRKFTTMSPKQPSITLPAIDFNFQGKHYVLSDSVTYSFSWVNDSSHMLYYFYQFYRGFVTCILFFAFANNLYRKYNEVFGGNSE